MFDVKVLIFVKSISCRINLVMKLSKRKYRTMLFYFLFQQTSEVEKCAHQEGVEYVFISVDDVEGYKRIVDHLAKCKPTIEDKYNDGETLKLFYKQLAEL